MTAALVSYSNMSISFTRMCPVFNMFNSWLCVGICVSCVNNSKLVIPHWHVPAFHSFEKLKKTYNVPPAHACDSFCILDFQKVDKVRDSFREKMRDYGKREEENKEGRLSHHPFIQSPFSACCFGNMMSVQPLATPLRLASISREACLCVCACMRVCVCVLKSLLAIAATKPTVT